MSAKFTEQELLRFLDSTWSGWEMAIKTRETADAIRACIVDAYRLRAAVEGWKAKAKVVRPGALFQSPIADSLVMDIRDFPLDEGEGRGK